MASASLSVLNMDYSPSTTPRLAALYSSTNLGVRIEGGILGFLSALLLVVNHPLHEVVPHDNGGDYAIGSASHFGCCYNNIDNWHWLVPT